MKLTNKAYLAVTVGAVLDLKHQSAKSNPSALKRSLAAVGSSTQVRIRASTTSTAGVDGPARDAGLLDEKLKAAEESLRMVVFLSCWGPN